MGVAILLLMGLAQGSANAEPVSSVDSDETVVFFPTFAYPTAAGDWELRFHGWIHERTRSQALFAKLCDEFGVEEGKLTPAERDILVARLDPFLVDNERGETIVVVLGKRRVTLNPSEPNGHFKGTARLSEAEVRPLRRSGGDGPDRMWFRAALPKGDPRVFDGEVFLLPAEGISVISDIDDTIRISNVLNRRELIRGTLLRPFEAAPGMAARYCEWRQGGATFHYVSAGPWQLFEPLSRFLLQAGFPAGTFHMRPFRLTDGTALAMFESPEPFKIAMIEEILQSLSRRRFILVGDSGERDPEVYGEIARRHPGRVERIFIREVRSEAPAERYERAFAGLAAETWKVFDDPASLGEADHKSLRRDQIGE